jgi:hypothetical protein
MSFFSFSRSGPICTASSTELHWIHWVAVWVMLRPTVSRPVCLGMKHPPGAYDQIFITVWPLRVFDMGRPLWREDGSVFYNAQYTINFTVSDLRPGHCIYIPQEQADPVIPPGTGYSITEFIAPTVLTINSRHELHRKHRSSIVAFLSVTAETCLLSRCPETGCVIPFIKNLLL